MMIAALLGAIPTDFADAEVEVIAPRLVKRATGANVPWGRGKAVVIVDAVEFLRLVALDPGYNGAAIREAAEWCVRATHGTPESR